MRAKKRDVIVKKLTRSAAVLQLKPARFTCTSAAMPPKVQDPGTFFEVNRGYIVFDKASCQGSTFETTCYCWDNFLRLSGDDPIASEMMCDTSCSLGPCDGRTCSSNPPSRLGKVVGASPPIQEPFPPERSEEEVMVPLSNSEDA